MAPKVIVSGVKQHLFDQSLQPTYHCIIFGPPLLKATILDPHKNHSTLGLSATILVIHRFWLLFFHSQIGIAMIGFVSIELFNFMELA
jgi:hypothetical protein